MTRCIIATLAAGLVAVSSSAQEAPYFQQRVDYAIDVRLDDQAHMLRATERFSYTNNSRVALDTIWIHLWPNAYRDRTSALCAQHNSTNDFDLNFAKPEDRGWIDSLDFKVQQATPPVGVQKTSSPADATAQRVHWGYHVKHPDIAWLKLASPLQPGSSITISTPFTVKLPSARFSRLGHIGQAYYITQWYPKPAVFDREGWHVLPYLSAGEFYSEFGSFDVSITLPENYVVGATGMLQQESEREWLDGLAAKELSVGGKNDFPVSSERMKTIRFKQDQVHDFAWIADKRFIVRKGEVTLEQSGRNVTTWAFFTPKNASDWKEAVDYVGQAVLHYSRWVGDYPYSACTAVDGTIAAGGGMEYPMITIIGEGGSAMALDEVIAHEVGHNWFYGILGSNEREHPWLDEGVNTFCELRYMNARYPGHKSVIADGIPSVLFGGRTIGHREVLEMAHRLNARRGYDQLPGLHSEEFTSINYGTAVYMKTALAFDHLFHALGSEQFDACMHAYYDTWHHKHPRPQDMKQVFENVSGRDLDWCFDGMIDSDQEIDLRAARLRDHTLKLKVQGPDGLPVPVTAYRGNDSLGTYWTTASQGINFMRTGLDSADRVVIDAAGHTLDVDHRNNEARMNGLCRGARPRSRFLTGMEDRSHRTTWWLPVIGRNAHDGFMAGLAVHNYHFPSQRFEYALAPLYAFGSERPVGGARADYHFDRTNSKYFRNLHLGASFQSFSLYNKNSIASWYEKWTPSVRIDLHRDLSRPIAHAIAFRGIFLNERVDAPEESPIISGSTRYTFQEFVYEATRSNGIAPFNVNMTVLNSEAFTRASVEGHFIAIYDRKKHRVALRAFVGQFLRKEEAMMQARYGWRFHAGNFDLLYDHLVFNRQPIGTLTDQQLHKDLGGFKTPNSYGTSDTWMAALNLEIDAPLMLPLSFFGSVGASPVTMVTSAGSTTRAEFQYEGGIGLRVMRDVLEVWVPLVVSEDIDHQLLLRDFDFTERIRFVIALEKLDPSRALRNLAP